MQVRYGSHHGDIPYYRLHFTLTDTPEKGVEINKVTVEKIFLKKKALYNVGKETKNLISLTGASIKTKVGYRSASFFVE